MGSKRMVAATDRDWFDTQHGAIAIAPSRNAPSRQPRDHRRSEILR
jgi:hypothetical protein